VGSQGHILYGRKFETSEYLKNHIKTFFDSKPSAFNQRGISQLYESWEKVVRERGQYIFID
jgi:hypothetical protein